MQRKVRSRASAIDTVRAPVQIGRAQEVAWPFSRRREPQAVVAQPRGPPITGNAMPVTRSVGCLGGDERRDRIAGREGLVQRLRSEEHTSELQSLMRISYAVFCLKKKTQTNK